jgi:hypothetical protein
MISSLFYLEHTGALSIDDSGMLEVFSRVVHLAKSSEFVGGYVSIYYYIAG